MNILSIIIFCSIYCFCDTESVRVRLLSPIYIFCYFYYFYLVESVIPSRNLDEAFIYNHIYGSNVPSKPLLC